MVLWKKRPPMDAAGVVHPQDDKSLGYGAKRVKVRDYQVVETRDRPKKADLEALPFLRYEVPVSVATRDNRVLTGKYVVKVEVDPDPFLRAGSGFTREGHQVGTEIKAYVKSFVSNYLTTLTSDELRIKTIEQRAQFQQEFKKPLEKQGLSAVEVFPVWDSEEGAITKAKEKEILGKLEEYQTELGQKSRTLESKLELASNQIAGLGGEVYSAKRTVAESVKNLGAKADSIKNSLDGFKGDYQKVLDEKTSVLEDKIIRIDGVLRDIGDNIKGKLDSFENRLSNIDKEISQKVEEWQGSYQPDFGPISSLLTEIKESIRKWDQNNTTYESIDIKLKQLDDKLSEIKTRPEPPKPDYQVKTEEPVKDDVKKESKVDDKQASEFADRYGLYIESVDTTPVTEARPDVNDVLKVWRDLRNTDLKQVRKKAVKEIAVEEARRFVIQHSEYRQNEDSRFWKSYWSKVFEEVMTEHIKKCDKGAAPILPVKISNYLKKDDLERIKVEVEKSFILGDYK